MIVGSRFSGDDNETLMWCSTTRAARTWWPSFCMHASATCAPYSRHQRAEQDRSAEARSSRRVRRRRRRCRHLCTFLFVLCVTGV